MAKAFPKEKLFSVCTTKKVSKAPGIALLLTVIDVKKDQTAHPPLRIKIGGWWKTATNKVFYIEYSREQG